jgi:hypothetical protein
MFTRLVTLGAAAALLAACSTSNPQDSSTSHAGGSLGQASNSPSMGSTSMPNQAGAMRPGTVQDFVTNVGFISPSTRPG